MKRIPGGYFISMEGGEGCGKSTHLELLKLRLAEDGFDVVEVSDTGGTHFGKRIRPFAVSNCDGMTELERFLFFAVSRSSNVRDRIAPSLSKGRVVLGHRFRDSSLIYQGVVGGVDSGFIEIVNREVCQNVKPDLTFVIDVDPYLGLQRADSSDNPGNVPHFIASRGVEYHRKINDAYKALADLHNDRMVLIPYVDGDVQGMHEEIYKVAKERIDAKLVGSN